MQDIKKYYLIAIYDDTTSVISIWGQYADKFLSTYLQLLVCRYLILLKDKGQYEIIQSKGVFCFTCYFGGI